MRLGRIFLVCTLAFTGSWSAYSQADEMATAVHEFQAGNYDKAISLLKKITSKDPANGRAWMFLGSAYYQREKFKESVSASQHAVDVDPTNETAKVNLAMGFMARNDRHGLTVAREVLKTNPKNGQANLIVAIYEYRDRDYVRAYDDAQVAVGINPRSSDAYQLTYLALLASISGEKSEKKLPGSKAELMKRGLAAFQKYYDSVPAAERKDLDQQVADLKFFAEYYGRPDSKTPTDADVPSAPDSSTTPLRILSKPRPSFTNSARDKMVNGSVLLLVGFGADGHVGPIMILKSLDTGLDRNCISAARSIKFTPESKDGKPVSVVKTIEYSFTIY
jgi:TonB family protein